MRILDQEGKELCPDAVDLEKGRLEPEHMFIAHHAAVEAVKEQGHHEIIAEYPNGGQDVAWVIDIPGIQAAEAWDEYEDIMRFVAYTAEELAERDAENRKRQERAERLEVLLQSAVLREELSEEVTKLIIGLLPKLWSGMEGSELYGNH